MTMRSCAFKPGELRPFPGSTSSTNTFIFLGHHVHGAYLFREVLMSVQN